MSGFDPDRFAAMLADARARRQALGALPPDVVPSTVAEGAAAQAALARRVGAMPPAGFKIGATAKRMQAYLGLSGPVAGFMPASGVHRSGAVLHHADFVMPGVECEVMVRLGRGLPPGPCTPAEARAAVDGFFAGIEVVENRYRDPAILGVPTLVADQVYHAACIAGAEPADWRALDIPALAGRLLVDGAVQSEGVAGDLLGDPFNCLAWLAGSDEVAAFGGLSAGQLVMLGSVTPPIWLARPGHVVVAFEHLPPVELHLT